MSKKYFLLGIGALFLAGVVIVAKSHKTYETNKSNQISISGKTLSVEIADTTQEREQGLSDRESLCSNCGLLFVFDRPGIYPFWMKKMNFNIDILWISGDKVADITFNAQKPVKEDYESPKEIFQSKTEIDKVLEVNAGWVKENRVKVGDKIKSD